ncbi:hypothetical protein CERZMDRAFT_92763 [Cercospora zeae-maydis SCOH1-5]|uniref:Uncharacterized protein n=1 Tax=Cercospora zeae-maydis SCOH1-5 TaxID=717836 RepID=A0A6A6FTH2_9PEZI|nr:hypothetical protein CERZMDRAFT_92763 [Cercospora zeae-maydis SCOH1-5]
MPGVSQPYREDQERQREIVENYRRICMIVAPQFEQPLPTPTEAEFYPNIRTGDDSDDEQWAGDIHEPEQIILLSYEGTLEVFNALVEARCPELHEHSRKLRDWRRALTGHV